MFRSWLQQFFSSLFFLWKNHPKSIYNNILSKKKKNSIDSERVKSCKTKKKSKIIFGSSIRPNISKSSFDDRVRNLNASFQSNEFDLGVAFMCIYANRFLEERRGEWDHVSIYLLFVKGKLYIYIIQGQRCYQPFPYIIPDINSILKTRIYPFYKRRVLYISEQTQ